MNKISLGGKWNLNGGGYSCIGNVPGSVYSFLLDNGLMEDPFYRMNELKALAIMDNEFVFSRKFDYKKRDVKVFLKCEGLDTLAEIKINGKIVGNTDNMHRTYLFDVTDILNEGENEIAITFSPIDPYIKEKQKRVFSFGPHDCMEGFAHIRKTECMMGWDWGPRLPDAGIWRDISLVEKDSAEITEFHPIQRHENGKVFVNPIVKTDGGEANVFITAPNGTKTELTLNTENEIENPELWYPNGLGNQPLYALEVVLYENGKEVDSVKKKLGLRDMKLIREKDKWGQGFCHEVNGLRFFAMGADYIPEDNIFSRITPERSRTLLKHCKDSNFNAIRIWGGGYYPDDWFFDICDELGIVVFFDIMFACTCPRLIDNMFDNIVAEVRENVARIRHHACIALISGNNEVEEELLSQYKGNEMTEEYLLLFEDVIPSILKELCPYIAYVPSSPSTCGHFLNAPDENYGDQHYWDVWHGCKPFTEYRKHYFRYLSEFGFQSFPCEKTVKCFTLPEDRNVFSRVMEMHQRNGTANGKILSYLSETYKYPADFGTLLYASQLLQAGAIRYGVEHLRRNRGRCMGTLYWQLNDIWPVASWASIDYYGRYKALQYYAKRFYAPIMLSIKETGERTTRPVVTMERTTDYQTKAEIFVTNDSLNDVNGIVEWKLCKNDGTVIKEGKENLFVKSFSFASLNEIDFNKTDVDTTLLYCRYIVDGNAVSESSVLFTAPKYFNWLDPQLSCVVNGDTIKVTSKAYVKDIEIYSDDTDFILSDNFFDMLTGTREIKILSGEAKNLKFRSVYDIK